MGFRSTVILAALLVALLGYLYFFEESKRDRALATSEARRILPVDEGALTRIVVNRRDTAMVFTRSGQGWRILEPIEADADKAEIAALVRSLKYIENKGRVADSGDVNLEDFGLSPPDISIVLSYGRGRADTLRWGDKSPTGRYAYLQVSGGIGIVKADSWAKGAIDKGLFRYRHKKAIRFEKSLVQRLEIEDNGALFSARREGKGWQIMAPISERADGQMLDRLINRIHTTRLKRFPEDTTRTGFDPPRFRISLFEGEGDESKTLLIGNRAGDDKDPSFFASSGSSVFVVDSMLVRDVRKLVSDARIKLVFGFVRSGVDSIFLAYRDSMVICVRDSVSTDWLVHEPALHLALDKAVQKLITEVLRLEAKRFVAESCEDPSAYGLDRPVFVAEFFQDKKLLQRLKVGGKGRAVYAVGQNRPQVVELVPSDLRKLKLKLLSVRPQVVDPDTIQLGSLTPTGI